MTKGVYNETRHDRMDSIKSTYAAYSLDNGERLSSSSGGIFSLLARVAFANGGVVYGVALSADCRAAEFIRVIDEEGLAKLRGSKYFQARVGNAFKQVKEDLNNGLMVLFSGTACQINGLTKFLGIDKSEDEVKEKYPNLICVDVICHGVPSPALWDKYVDYIEDQNQAQLVSINFRCKDKGWKNFGMKEIDEHHKAMFISKDTDPFMQMFLRDYCLRPSCYECKSKEYKLSDMTIADFWGIEAVAPDMMDGNGTSLVIVRSEKGKELLDAIKDKIRIKEVGYEDGVKSNPADYKSAVRPLQRDCFFDDLHSLSFEELKKKYASPISVSMKRRIKASIKNILARAGFVRGGGGITIMPPMDYCLCFVLKVEND